MGFARQEPHPRRILPTDSSHGILSEPAVCAVAYLSGDRLLGLPLWVAVVTTKLKGATAVRGACWLNYHEFAPVRVSQV